ncbi:MAG: transposase [Candidatus Thermoplasmatota archaeon]|nr:transposase [Candidatus Thermoplasmatota archaeon]
MDGIRILHDFKTINVQLFNEWIDRPKKNVYLAVDYHDIPRYPKKKRDWKPRKKKCDDIDKIVHSKKQSGTHNFHRIISADVVDDEKFTIDFEPVFPDAIRREILLCLIEKAKKMVHIKAVLMDREFFAAPIVSSLQAEKIPFVIRAIKTKRTNTFLEELKEDKRIWKVYEYEFNKTSHGSRKRQRIKVKTHLVIVDNSKVEGIPAEKYDEDDRYFMFITNILVHSQETAFQLARDFRKRWGIETGYKTKKQFRGKTCSLSYAVRLFLILLSFVLYNLWISINSKLKNRIWNIPPKQLHITAALMAFFCLIQILSRRIFIEK